MLSLKSRQGTVTREITGNNYEFIFEMNYVGCMSNMHIRIYINFMFTHISMEHQTSSGKIDFERLT